MIGYRINAYYNVKVSLKLFIRVIKCQPYLLHQKFLSLLDLYFGSITGGCQLTGIDTNSQKRKVYSFSKE